jgi:hypothetical protein
MDKSDEKLKPYTYFEPWFKSSNLAQFYGVRALIVQVRDLRLDYAGERTWNQGVGY